MKNKVDFKDRKKLPSKSGIYFVVWGGAVIYVGQARDIRKRWQNHHVSALIDELWGHVEIAYELFPEISLDEVERFYISSLRPPINLYTYQKIGEPETYKEYIRHLMKILNEKYGNQLLALRAVNIPKGHFYNVINPNKETTAGNPFYTPIEWMVKLTRDSRDYCMLKKVAKDCDCILITPEDIKELQSTDPAAALSVLQKVIGLIK